MKITDSEARQYYRFLTDQVINPCHEKFDVGDCESCSYFYDCPNAATFWALRSHFEKSKRRGFVYVDEIRGIQS